MATWNDLTRRLFRADLTDDECYALLWVTCYPAGSLLQVARQLYRAGRKHGGDVSATIAEAHAELDADMTEFHRQQAEQGIYGRDVVSGHLQRLESDSGWLKWRHACETEDQCGRYTKAEPGNETFCCGNAASSRWTRRARRPPETAG